LSLDRPFAPEHLVLEAAERLELSLRGDDLLHAVGAEGADQLVLEILVADVCRVAEHAAEEALLAGVAETDDLLPLVLGRRATDRLRAADGDDLDPIEVQRKPARNCFERDAVGDAFDEDDGHGRKLA
jgi:hypothetical protein